MTVFKSRHGFLNAALFALSVLSSLVIDRFHILSNQDLMKGRLFCAVQLLSDFVFFLFVCIFIIVSYMNIEFWLQLMFANI